MKQVKFNFHTGQNILLFVTYMTTVTYANKFYFFPCPSSDYSVPQGGLQFRWKCWTSSTSMSEFLNSHSREWITVNLIHKFVVHCPEQPYVAAYLKRMIAWQGCKWNFFHLMEKRTRFSRKLQETTLLSAHCLEVNKGDYYKNETNSLTHSHWQTGSPTKHLNKLDFVENILENGIMLKIVTPFKISISINELEVL